MRALVVAHDHASPHGHVGRRLTERGFTVDRHLVVPEERYADPGVTTDFPDFTGYDVVVLLGSPWGVYEKERLGTWLLPEQEQLRAADAAGTPVLGICFGGQLLADTHGGSVAPSPHPEIGFVEVSVSADGEGLVSGGPWFEWHFDRWELPPDAVELARNDAASQAFVLRRNLAVQFHPEIDADGVQAWIDNGGAAELAERGIDAGELVDGVRATEASSYARAAALVDAFLERVAGLE